MGNSWLFPLIPVFNKMSNNCWTQRLHTLAHIHVLMDSCRQTNTVCILRVEIEHHSQSAVVIVSFLFLFHSFQHSKETNITSPPGCAVDPFSASVSLRVQCSERITVCNEASYQILLMCRVHPPVHTCLCHVLIYYPPSSSLFVFFRVFLSVPVLVQQDLGRTMAWWHHFT